MKEFQIQKKKVNSPASSSQVAYALDLAIKTNSHIGPSKHLLCKNMLASDMKEAIAAMKAGETISISHAD